MSKNVYQIGSGELTFEIIERIINENLKLELAPEAKLRIQKCRDYLDHKIASSEEPLYGITTGFGSLCTKNISSGELGTLQENLIKSHACSVGEEIRPVIIKLMMLLKAHALSLGHSGVQLITVQRILDFFNNDVLPIVYDRGSLGASGDLAPLANLFLPLIGVGDVNYKGKKCEAISVLDEFGWEPVRLMSKEGLELLVLPDTPAALRVERHHHDRIGLLIADDKARALLGELREELLGIEVGGHRRLLRPAALVGEGRRSCGDRHEACGPDELSACDHLHSPPDDTAFLTWLLSGSRFVEHSAIPQERPQCERIC